MKLGRDIEFGDTQGIGIKVFVNISLFVKPRKNNFGPYITIGQ